MSVIPFDERGFERELVSLIPSLRAFGRHLAGYSTAGDDLAQEAMAKAWKARTRFEPGTNMKAWTFMILRNQFYSEKRRSWRTVDLDPELAERTLVANENPTAAIELDELRRAIAMLPAAQREPLILVAAGSFSYEEASKITGVNIGTVKSRVSRARDQLTLILAERGLSKDGLPSGDAMGGDCQLKYTSR